MMLRRLGLPFLLLLAFCLSSAGQCNVPGQSIQPVTLRVSVWYSDGRKAEEQLRVELVNPFGNYLAEAFTSSDGQAEFHNLVPGRYRLRVHGGNVEETTTDVFHLVCNEGEHFENVDVRSKSGANAPTPTTPGGTVAAVDLNVPDKAKKEFDKGNAALLRNDLAGARKAFEKAVALYPMYASAYNNLGIVAMKTGDRAAALAAFQKAVQINDHYPRACLNLARLLLGDRNYADAEGLLNRALSTDPLNLEALTMLANLQLQTGHYDQAISTAWRVHSVPHDGFSVVHILAALAFESRHMPADAAAEYATYLKESPNGPEAQRASAALAALQSKGP